MIRYFLTMCSFYVLHRVDAEERMEFTFAHVPIVNYNTYRYITNTPNGAESFLRS
jgi:hypothetical protein